MELISFVILVADILMHLFVLF